MWAGSHPPPARPKAYYGALVLIIFAELKEWSLSTGGATVHEKRSMRSCLASKGLPLVPTRKHPYLQSTALPIRARANGS